MNRVDLMLILISGLMCPASRAVEAGSPDLTRAISARGEDAVSNRASRVPEEAVQSLESIDAHAAVELSQRRLLVLWPSNPANPALQPVQFVDIAVHIRMLESHPEPSSVTVLQEALLRAALPKLSAQAVRALGSISSAVGREDDFRKFLDDHAALKPLASVEPREQPKLTPAQLDEVEAIRKTLEAQLEHRISPPKNPGTPPR